MRTPFPQTSLRLAARNQIHDIAELIESLTRIDGGHSTAMTDLFLYRASAPTSPTSGLAEPAVCIVAQGRKEVMLADELYVYDPANYLVVSVDLPVVGRVVEASRERPYLGLRITINPGQVGNLIGNSSVHQVGTNRSQRGLAVSPACPSLLNAVHRFVQLLNTPEHISVLAPLIKQEILYRLLCGDQGAHLRQISLANSQVQRIARAIQWIKSNYTQTLRVEELASLVNMSQSSFHHQFKAVTAMSPLQFQKQLRLQEARRLLLAEDIDVASAGHRVGYESQSQFSREYSRLFGAPPLRDAERMRSIS
jgi:AraC-like DNA-binding protein